ncbi:uncharacterized protein E0L32_009758 [Thyridium curvatum]|uniref:C2H2-type domain-containing protein n=1 Tax=Thyridium curvatum TaxID=1093900 RepID=A0A507AVE8_9PEZI|nr:uncharacterized protein E0L32_009758 [Thyridium curvatum]TPX08818.1 hypothetical protein E0L32_009758 [Thyridium curvatum]
MVEPAGDPSMLFESPHNGASQRASLIEQSVSCLYERNIVQNPTTARMLLMFLRDFVDSQAIYSPWPQPCFCPMMKCREAFTEPLSLIQHLLFCPELSQGEFECWKCRRCHEFPTDEKGWAEWSGWTPHRIDDCPRTPIGGGPENEFAALSPADLTKAFLEGSSVSDKSPVSTWDQLSNPSIPSQLGSPGVFASPAQGSEAPHTLGLGTPSHPPSALGDLQRTDCAAWTPSSIADTLIADSGIDWSGFGTDNLGLLPSPSIQQIQSQLGSPSATEPEEAPPSTQPAQPAPPGHMHGAAAAAGAFPYSEPSPFAPPPSMYSVGGFIAMSRTSSVTGRGHTHSASTSPFWSSRHGQPPFATIRNSRSLVPRKRSRASFATRQPGGSAPSISSPPNPRSASIPEIGSASSLGAASMSPVGGPLRPNRFSSQSATSFEDFINFNTSPVARGMPEGGRNPPPEAPDIAPRGVRSPFAQAAAAAAADDLASPLQSDAISMDTTLAESTAAEDDDNNEGGELRCDLCDWKPRGVKENLKGYLRKHKNNHRGLRYPCEIAGCKKTFSRLDNLKKHIKDKHGIDVTTATTTTTTAAAGIGGGPAAAAIPVKKEEFATEGLGLGAEAAGPEMMVMTIPQRPREDDGVGGGLGGGTAEQGGQAKMLPQHTMLWHLNLS